VITLAATNTLQGSAGTATAVTYTITGMTLSSTQIESYLVLAQGQLATSAGALYTVPAATTAMVKEILLANTTAAAVSVKLFVNGTAAANQITSLNIPANGEAKFDHTGWAVYDASGNLQLTYAVGGAPAGSVPETSVANLSTDLAIASSGMLNNGVDSGCVVSWVSGYNIAIAAGVVRINGNRYNIAAVASQALATADANYQRWDLVTANTSLAVVVTAGTPAAYPVLPAIPANSVVLAAIPVYAGNNPALSGAAIIDKRLLLATVNTNLERMVDPSVALKVYRGAIANRDNRPVDLLFLGDSIHEGYWASEDKKRYIYLIIKRLQALYNATHIPGGEGFIPAYHGGGGGGTPGVPPLGGFMIPQRWTWTGPNVPPGTGFTEIGYGFGRRSANLATQTNTATITNLLCDRFWLYYTALTTTGWIGIAIDGKLSTVATQGVLSGTATGTFTTTLASGWPGGTFTMTVDDEDMTVTANGATITITARGANATTAVAHAVGNTVQWAPAGVTRLNTTGAATKSGRRWDSGVLTRGLHSVTLVPISRAGGGGTWNVWIDGIMVFDGDGSASPATFTDAVIVGTTTTGIQTLPTATINVVSTTNFPASGQATVVTTGGNQNVTYTGVGAGTLTGCTGGSGNTSAGGAVTSMTLQSATAAFVAADVGKAVYGTGIQQTSTISAVVSGTQVTLSAAGTITAAGVQIDINGRGAGIRMWESAHSAYEAGKWSGPAGATAGYWADALDTATPDLVVIEFGIIDLVLATPLATFIANVNAVISLINSKCASTPSYIFFIPWTPDATVATNQPWPSYVNALYLLANQNGATIFDFSSKLTPAASTGSNASAFGDTYHPNDAGASDIALEFTRFLTGSDQQPSRWSPWFGDGSDGALVYDGTTTILGMAPAANVYTLTRDIFATNMTVNNGVTIKTGGFRIYCTGILATPLSGTGIIDNSGGNASGQTAGAATPSTGTTAFGTAGGAGGAVGGAGVAGTGQTAINGPIIGGAGGIGGASTGAAGAAGATANTANLNNARTVHSATTGVAMPSVASPTRILFVQPGQGGGGGGGGAAVGGGGGAGGGLIVVAAAIMAFMGLIQANGGNGGASTGGAGGGGGGGGGIYVTTTHLSSQGTWTAAGGFPGTGTAGAPATGAAGSVIIQRV
jgi:hypothetical protein